MAAQIRTGEMSRGIVIEVFYLTFRSVASVSALSAACTNRELSVIQFAHRSALGLESIHTSIISSDSIAGMVRNSASSPNNIARNNDLSIELSLGATTIRGCVRRGIIATSGEEGCHAESGNHHELFHFVLH